MRIMSGLLPSREHPGKSLYALLGGVIVAVVVAVLGVHAAYAYLSQRQQIIEEMKQNSALSLVTLQKNIIPLIEAYAINEYDKLLATEIELRQHFALIVTDLNMGKIRAEDAYISGKIRDAAGGIIDFNPHDPAHRQWLDGSFHSDTIPLVAPSGARLGSLSVYNTDGKVKQALNRILIENLVNTVFIALLLIVSLVFAIHRFLVRPLSQLAAVIGQTDRDGIPVSPIPSLAYREIAILTDTMNTMIQVISRSRDLLQKGHLRLQNILVGTNIGTWEWNVQTGETVFNERWAEMIGYTLAELQPVSIDTWLRFAHPDDLKASGERLEAHFSGQVGYYECEARMRHKEGHWVWVLDRGRVSTWTAEGKPLWMAGTHWDITERKQAEQTLKESESRQRAIIQNEPECIKIVDAQGRLTLMNPAGLAMIEADSLEHVAGRPVIGLIAPEYREAFVEMSKRVLCGESAQMEFEIIGLKGGRHWMETHAVPIQENGQRVQLAVTRDITERKQAEHVLQQQTDALARSNAELEQFAYAVSHDLRQPLRMVNSYIQLIELALADTLNDDTRRMMHFAVDGAKRMDQMLVSLLEYSRVGRKGEPFAPLSSRNGVDEALRFLAPVIREANATVRVSGDWPEVVASRDEFTRLWQNLIGNAVKYRVPDRAPEIDITVTPDADGWRFCVADNGIGIAPAQFDRLFKVFQRLVTREQYEGTGVGLAVAHKIVERHGGRIWVESSGAGLGCRFCFNWPRALTTAKDVSGSTGCACLNVT
jgi:PAS domain S-box-containing protein